MNRPPAFIIVLAMVVIAIFAIRHFDYIKYEKQMNDLKGIIKSLESSMKKMERDIEQQQQTVELPKPENYIQSKPQPIPEPIIKETPPREIKVVDKDSLEKIRNMTLELNKANHEKLQLEEQLKKNIDVFTQLQKRILRNYDLTEGKDLDKLRKDLLKLKGWDKESNRKTSPSLSSKNHASIIQSIMKDIHNERFEWTPLHFSAYHGMIEIVQFIIDEGFNPIETDNSGLSPIHLAVIAKRIRTVELLGKSGAKVNEQDIYGRTPLHYAVATDHRTVKVLLDLGADPIIMDHRNRSPIHVAAETGNTKAAQVLLQAGAKIDAKDLRQWNAHHYASYFNKTNMIKFLDQRGLSLDGIDFHKQTPLHISSKYNAYEAMQTLLELGASAQSLDSNGRSPLHNAASNGNLKMVNLLISYNAIISLPDNYKQSPLFYAAKNNHSKVCDRLIQLGSNIKLQDFLGRTVFHIASIYGNDQVNKIMIHHPKYEDTLDHTNRTPLDWAKYYNRNHFLDIYKRRFGK